MSLTTSTTGITKAEKPRQINHCVKFKLCRWKTLAKTGMKAIAKIDTILTNKEITKVLFLNGFEVKIEWLVRTLKIWNNWMKFNARNPIVEAIASL